MVIVIDDDFTGYDISFSGDWVTDSGTPVYTNSYVNLPTANIVNTKSGPSSSLGSTIEIELSFAANTSVFEVSIYDGTRVFGCSVNSAFAGGAGTISFFDVVFSSYAGSYSYPGDDVRMKLRLSVDNNGSVFVYADDVLIANAEGGVGPNTTASQIQIGSTGEINIYSVHMVNQFLDPSDPLPHNDYSGGNLYCTNDDIRKAGDYSFYKEEQFTSNTDTTLNIKLDRGMKIKELDKITVAAGKLPQLTQVKFAPATGEFMFIPPKRIIFYDSFQASDQVNVLFQTHSTDDEVHRARKEIQNTINSKITHKATTPLVPGVTLYDQIIEICANLTKLKLLKDSGLKSDRERAEVNRQWKYYMNWLDNLGSTTIGGTQVDEDEDPRIRKVLAQTYRQSNRDNRRRAYNTGD